MRPWYRAARAGIGARPIDLGVPGTVSRCASPTPSRPALLAQLPPRCRRGGRASRAARRSWASTPPRWSVGSGADALRALDAPGARVLGRLVLRSSSGTPLERVVPGMRRCEDRRRSPMSCSPGSAHSRASAPSGAITVRGDGAGRAPARRAGARRRPSTLRTSARPARAADGARASTATTTRPRRGDPRAAPGGRVLPGEPHPPAHLRRRARPRRAVRRARDRGTRRRTRRCCGSRCRDARHRGRLARRPSGSSRGAGAAVETRPIKGTGRDAAVLRASAKDHAENVMIVDLARNDLGRVCDAGFDPRAVAVRGRSPPRAAPPREHRARRAPPRRRHRRHSSRPRSHPRRSPARRSRGCCRPSKTSSRCGAASTAARSAGSTPNAAKATSPSPSARSPSFDDRTELGVGGGIVADSPPDVGVGGDRAEGVAGCSRVAGAGVLVPS